MPLVWTIQTEHKNIFEDPRAVLVWGVMERVTSDDCERRTNLAGSIAAMTSMDSVDGIIGSSSYRTISGEWTACSK